VRKTENRKVEDEVEDECFILVGDCFVQGIMDGETMENPKTPMYLV
jgi:hypothetical protein